jgi:AbrB family looped-hinge helix DNA binding protein
MESHNGHYAWTLKVGEKGQIVIPKEAREIFEIKPGDTIVLLGDEAAGLAIPSKKRMKEIENQVFGAKKQ